MHKTHHNKHDNVIINLAENLIDWKCYWLGLLVRYTVQIAEVPVIFLLPNSVPIMIS